MEQAQLNSAITLNSEYFEIDKKKKCQNNNIKKKVKKGYRQFTKEEDQLLLLQIVRNGKRFEAIAKTFPKRSKHELKNRYYTYLKYRENELFDSNSYYSLNNIGWKNSQKTKTVTQNDLLQVAHTVEMDLTAKLLVQNFIERLNGFFSDLKQSLQN